MNIEMNTISPPSLLGTRTDYRHITQSSQSPISAHTLLDLMYDGFYVLFMLRKNCEPEKESEFFHKLKLFLDDFEGNAKNLGISTENIEASKYAFCAAVDEIILRSSFSVRDIWEQRPLQLSMFGDQLAGENFFYRLESLRAKGSAHWQALEIFHMCLLLGFQGKYLIEGSEKLTYLTARLGEEITQIRKKSTGFAPHAERPDHIINKLRSEVPMWTICSVFALIGIFGYLGLNWMLSRSTENTISVYSEVVKPSLRTANLTITLP